MRKAFPEWLHRQRFRTDAIGDLARDTQKDIDWPKNGISHKHYAEYMTRKSATEGEIAALYNAWCEWSQKFFGAIRMEI